MEQAVHHAGKIELSIVIPTYNKAAFLPLLFNSLLKQDYSKNRLEVIVVDDGSTDKTQNVIDEYSDKFECFTCIRQSNNGIGAARNAGLKIAKGQLIAFLADDYILDPSYCSSLVSVFSDPSITAVRSYPGSVGNTALERLELYNIRLSIVKNLNGDTTKRLAELSHAVLPAIAEPFCGVISLSGAAMMRRSIFDTYGYFDETLVTGEDTEYAYRMLSKANIKMHFYPAVLFHIQFRTRFSAYFKRCHEYSFNGIRVLRNYHQAPQDSFINKVFRQLTHMRLILRQNDSPVQAVKMIPYLVFSRFALLTGRLRG